MVQLSLAVAANGTCDASAFFRALGAADAGFVAPDIDIHIAHNGGLATDRPVGWNIHFHACAPDTPVFHLLGVAIAASVSEYVAVLDIQVPPAPGWLARVQTEINKGTPLFFGPVEPGMDWSDRRMVGYLAEYAQFSSPLPVHIGEVPGNNLVFRRGLGVSDDVEISGFFKTFMIWRLGRELGLAPQAFNDMTVVYQKDFSLGQYLSMRVSQGRTFATRRHGHPGQPAKLLCIAFTPFLPFLRIWRILRATRHTHRRATLRHLHLLVLSEAAWSLGEFLGYAVSGGVAADHSSKA